LADYENELQTTETGSLVDCETVTKLRDQDQWDKACRFDITNELGDACVKQQSFGYEDGQPCVLLKLNRVRWFMIFCYSFYVLILILLVLWIWTRLMFPQQPYNCFLPHRLSNPDNIFLCVCIPQIFDWLPEPYTNDTLPEELRNSPGLWQEYSVTVKCEGEVRTTLDIWNCLLSIWYYQWLPHSSPATLAQHLFSLDSNMILGVYSKKFMYVLAS